MQGLDKIEFNEIEEKSDISLQMKGAVLLEARTRAAIEMQIFRSEKC